MNSLGKGAVELKKLFARIFIILEFAMLALVLCTFVKRHTEVGKSYGYGVYFGEDYPLTVSYEDYRTQVEERLASGDYSTAVHTDVSADESGDENADGSSAKNANEGSDKNAGENSGKGASESGDEAAGESSDKGTKESGDKNAEENSDKSGEEAAENIVESEVYKSIMGTSTTSVGALQRLSNVIETIETKIEDYTNSQKILGKNSFVEAKKTMDQVTGLDMTASLTGGQNSDTDVRDVVVPTEEGQLGWVQDDYDITEELDNLVDFGLQMEADGRNFLLVENPNKYAESDAFEDYSEEKYRQIESAVTDAGLDMIDLQSAFADMGLTEKDIFFDTDFHWKPQSGVLADGIVADYLNQNYGYSIDCSLYDSSMYEEEIEEDGFLGYLGKKVTLAYTEPDDFTILHPTYETDYRVYNSYDGSEKTGSVEDTLYWYERLDEDSLYDGNKYEFYGYSDQTLISIHNNLQSDGKRILVLKESYANCMIPYLAAGVEDMDVIDLRLFCGSIRDYIEETNPDTVIVLYGLSSYEDDTVEEGLFDFR